MEGTKKIRRSRKRWGYDVEEDLNGPVMGAKNKQAMATDRRECTETVMGGSPQRSVALEEGEEEEKQGRTRSKRRARRDKIDEKKKRSRRR